MSALVYWSEQVGMEAELCAIPQRPFRPHRLVVLTSHPYLNLRNVRVGVNSEMDRDTCIPVDCFA